MLPMQLREVLLCRLSTRGLAAAQALLRRVQESQGDMGGCSRAVLAISAMLLMSANGEMLLVSTACFSAVVKDCQSKSSPGVALQVFNQWSPEEEALGADRSGDSTTTSWRARQATAIES